MAYILLFSIEAGFLFRFQLPAWFAVLFCPLLGIMKTVASSIILLFCASWLLAQKSVDTLIQLPQISVEDADPSLRDSGRNWIRSDTLLMQINSMNNLGELLSSSSMGFVKSYGPAGVSSTSLRGASAAQTAVLWNGVNVQNPMLGQTDLSLFPAMLADEVLISKRGPATAGIQGALGGAIQLKNKFSADGFKLNMENGTGSFGAFNNAVKVYYGNNALKGITRIYHNQVKNNFAFEDLQGNPKILDHAKVLQWGLAQDIEVNTGKVAVLEGHFWRQFSKRQLPPNKLQSKSVAEQDDDSWRNVLKWRKWSDKHAFSITGALLMDNLNYTDSLALIYSSSKSHMIDLKAAHQYYPEFGQFSFALAYQYISASTNNYDFIPNRNSWTANAVLRKKMAKEKLIVEASLSTSLIDGFFQPLLPSLQFDWQFNKKIRANVAVLRNFRFPTFNDLYWVPGGNPELSPEISWNYEAGFALDVPFEKTGLHWQSNIQVFSRIVDDWILWQPAGVNWQPINARKVWSRGFETETSISKRYARAYWMVMARYQFVRSTNIEARIGNQEILGKQLIYQPAHLGGITFSGSFKKLSVYYAHRWTSKLFTTTDNSGTLSGYSLGDFSLSRAFEFNSGKISLTASVNNIWNKRYEVVAFYPMPGRNYALKLSTSI
jgi:vitamin B12 transporter